MCNTVDTYVLQQYCTFKYKCTIVYTYLQWIKYRGVSNAGCCLFDDTDILLEDVDVDNDRDSFITRHLWYDTAKEDIFDDATNDEVGRNAVAIYNRDI